MSGPTVRKVSTTTGAVLLRRLVTIVVLINLFVAGEQAWSLHQSRRQYEEQAATLVRNLSQVLERDIAGTIDRIDMALLATADEYVRQRAGGRAETRAMNRYIGMLHSHLRNVDALRMTDAQGVVVYGNDVASGSAVSVADRPHFIRLRDDPKSGLTVSLPQQSRFNKKWVIVFARRVDQPDGTFAGMVYAPVVLEQFSNAFAAIDMGRLGSMSLRDRELRILARYPKPKAPEVIGRTLPVPPLQALVESGGSYASYVTDATVDRVERRFSVRRISNHPLYIVVGRSTKESLAPWRDQVAQAVLLFALFCLGTLISSWLIYRRWMGQLAAAAETTRAEEAVRQLNAELERRVIERTAQLEAANKELEEFSYSISHDLRSPLRAIAGFSEILIEDYGPRLDDEGRRLLSVVRDNGLRMGRLIDGILHFLHLGRQPLHPSTVDMVALAREVFAELAPVGRQVRFHVDDLPTAQGDLDMLRQVLARLMSNAVKFTSSKAEGVVEVGGTPGEEQNTYFVRDNGIGFDMRYANKLFHVFEHLHGEEQFRGTGIGLAIVKRIILRHGGRVWAEGRVGDGATIYFTLPRGGQSEK